MRPALWITGIFCCMLIAGTVAAASTPDVVARLQLNNSVTVRQMTVGTGDTIDIANLSLTMTGLLSTSGDNTDVKTIAHPAFRNLRRVFSTTSVSSDGNNLTILGPADSTVSWTGLPNYTIFTTRNVPTLLAVIPGEQGNIVLAKVNTTVVEPNITVIVNATDVMYFYTPQGIVAAFPASNTYVTAGLINASDFDINNLTYTLEKNKITLDNFLVNRDYAQLLSTNQSGARPVPGLYALEIFEYNPATDTILNLASLPVVVLDGDNPISLPGLNPPYTYQKATGTGINLTFMNPANVTNISYLLIKKDETYDLRMDIDLVAFARNANTRWTFMHPAGFPLATIAEQAVIGDIGAENGINYSITRVGSPPPQPPVNWYTIAISPGYGISGRGVSTTMAFIPPGDINTLVAGDYYLYAVGTSAKNDVSALDQQQITIAGGLPPNANFTADKTSGPPPLTVRFNDTSTGVPAAWQWGFGDNTPNSSIRDPVHTYTADGNYTVTLAVTNSDGSDSLARTGYIRVRSDVPPLPHALYGNLMIQGVPAPAGSTVVAVVSGGGGSLDTTSTGRYGETGPFGQKLLVQGFIINGSPMSFTVNGAPAEAHDVQSGDLWVQTYPFTSGAVTDLDLRVPGTPVIPVADFSGTPRAGDVPLLVKFTDLSSGLPVAWNWNFGDGTPNSSARNPLHHYQQAGTFMVTLTASNAAGSDTEVKPGYITVNATPVPPPVANFTANNTSGMAPLYVQFTDTSTGDIFSWRWNFGDNRTSSEQNPVHKYRGPGNFTVSLAVTGAGGNDTEQKPAFIQVFEGPPEAAFSANTTAGYVPLTVGFIDESTGGPLAWSWEFGDGGNSTEQDPVHRYEIAGNYTVNLTVSNSFGVDTRVRQDYITVLLPPPPVAEFSANPLTGYEPQVVGFTDLSTNNPASWAWNFGEGHTSTEQNPSHTFYSGIFTISLEVTNAGGSANITKTKYITIYQSGGGGGGGNGGGGYVIPVETAKPTPIVTVTPIPGGLPLGPDKRTTREVVISSTDGIATLWFDKGVKLTCNEEALHTIILTVMKAGMLPPVPDADRYALTGYAYLVEPVCGVFDPSGLLSFTITPSDWESLKTSELTIRWWDEATGTWISLPTSVDADTRGVSAPITRAGIYAIFRTITPGTTTVPATSVPPTTITPPGGIAWMYLIAGILIVLIALMIILFFLLQRKTPPPEPPATAPDWDEFTPPVR